MGGNLIRYSGMLRNGSMLKVERHSEVITQFLLVLPLPISQLAVVLTQLILAFK